MLDIELLKRICECPGAPGFENKIRNLVIEEIKNHVDEYRIDALGNLIAIIKGKDSSKKLACPAHIDEISFIVTHIDEDGFVRFHTLGGFDPKTLTAQRVIIHGKKNIIGVMGSKPIHVMTPEERNKAPQIKEYFIDTGMKKEEVCQYIEIGDPITRERELIQMGDCINSKSIDNRISVFILIEALKKLKSQRIPYDFYALFTVQEEVGLRGATAVASSVNPDFVINLDTTLAFDLPGASGQEVCTKLGNGTAIKVLDGMTICDQRMVRYLKTMAQTHKIPYQMEILPAGGTDTASLQRYSKGGSIAGGISIPTRYLHQVIEMCDKNDVAHSIELLVESVKGMSDFDMNW
ncbi:MAG: M42 family metallopeptidase [Saprospiraceae bacterium]|nr:M42 family metallopeptidase [Saprospiraceae bacterium]MCB9327415.1 M42 family metallopeptidase [Lewinellaceae bacterium]